VDVGGYRVHLYCAGVGSPTVVITGAGFSFDWGLVQPEVSKFTRVCAYDHSGIAWSDPAPEVDSCWLRVREVHAALEKAGIAGPYILVGQSLGAVISRLYAGKYPDDVAGMVIVDHAAVLNDMTSRRSAHTNVAPDKPPRAMPPNLPAGPPPPDPAFGKLAPRDYELHLWATSQAGFMNSLRATLSIAPACLAEVENGQNGKGALAEKPLVVLSRWGSPQDLQSKLLALSLDSKQVVAERSGHYIMIDRPDVVIGAIHDIIDAVRNHTKLNR